MYSFVKAKISNCMTQFLSSCRNESTQNLLQFLSLNYFIQNLKSLLTEFMPTSEEDYLFQFLQRIAEKLNRPFEDIKPYYWTLKQNWYDSEETLRKVTDVQYEKMKVPVRLVDAIRQELKVEAQQSEKINGGNQHQKDQQKILSPQKVHDSSKKGSTRKTLSEVEIAQLCQGLELQTVQHFGKGSEEAANIFQTLDKIISNIVADPYEMKFCTLKKSNGMVQKIILANGPVLRFLKRFDFEEDEAKIFLDAPQVHELIVLEEILAEQSQRLRKSVHKPFLGDVKMPAYNPTQSSDSNKMIEQQFSSFDQQFKGEKMAEVKYVDALQRLIEFRRQVMSKPPSDRKLRIYHKRHENRNLYVPEVDMAEEFEKSEDKQIQSYWKNLMAENKKNSTFQSKRKQEFEFLVKQKIHKETVMKVKLPNEYIIEARFGPLETLQDVFAVVSDVVIGDLYLFQAPPLKRYDKEMHKTLQELQSVPTGSFYMGSNGEYYINNKYVGIIHK